MELITQVSLIFWPVFLIGLVFGFLVGKRYSDRQWYENGDDVLNPRLEKKWFDLK